MEIVYVLVAVALIVGGYFLFFQKSAEPEQLERAKRPEKLPAAEKAARRAAPSAEDEEDEDEEGEEDEEVDEAPAEDEAPSSEAEQPGRPSLEVERDVQSLRKGLAKSRGEEGFFGKLKALFTGQREIDSEIAGQIEEVLLGSDVGVKTTEAILARIKEDLDRGDLVNADRVWSALREEANRILHVDGEAGPFQLRGKPTVVLLVGVNGSGKTTTIGKLATKLKEQGHECVLAAGDTFRAAAVQQLVVWGQRVGCEVVRGKEGADPGSVIFDAIKKAEETGADVVLADTAGRLHTKTNLMNEMAKIAKTAAKAMDGAPHETLLVVDATTGQNALAQAKEFKDALDLTGLVLTKLDGTAKGGVVLGISDELGLPVRFIGLGERADDLHAFSASDFVEALLGKDVEASAA